MNDDNVCGKSELELFTLPPTNVSMESGEFVQHFPISTLTDHSPIEFNIPASPDSYTDIGRTKLYLKAKVVKADGSAIADTAKVVPCNLLLHSLFSQVDVTLNDRVVTPALNTYPYKAYLETLLSHGLESKKSWLSCELWTPDNDHPGAIDPTDNDDSSRGMKDRYKVIKSSRVFELMGRPHVDIFQQDRYLLNGVNMNVKFIRSPTLFHLIGALAKDCKVHIMEAKLLIRRVKINPTLTIDHARTLDSGVTAKYPLRRGVVTTFSIPQGTQSYVKENIKSNHMPRRAFVAFVPNVAYNGSGAHNPFNFKHYNMSHLQIHVGNQSFPAQPYSPDFEHDRYMPLYNDLLQATGHLNSEQGFGVDYDHYKKAGNIVAGFDFTPDLCEGAHLDPPRFSSMRLEVKFGAALNEAVSCILYMEYDNLVEADVSRNFLSDFGMT